MTDQQRVLKFAKKVGFGFRPDEAIPSDAESWIDAQLAEPRRFLGIASLKNPSRVETWPAHHLLNIHERFDRAWDHRAKEIELNDNPKLTAREIEDAFRAFNLQTLPTWHDETRLYHRAIYAPDQIRQRFVHFWANHFFVSGSQRSNVLLGDHLERAVEGQLDGSFAEMVYNASASPAMLRYLDNTENVGENSKRALREREQNRFAGLNDNLAREVLELHTVSPSMGYTEADIHAMAKVLSGWGLGTGSHEVRGRGIADFHHPFEPHHAQRGLIEIFGMRVGSQFGTSQKSLGTVLTYLAEHPNTRAHLSRKLCTHFIADDPPEDSVQRVMAVWADTHGSLPSIHRQVLVEALRHVETHSKFLWPLTWMLQAIRQSGASIVDGWDDVNVANYGFMSQANRISRELSQGWYTERLQPNGFSVLGHDWISPAHFERRLKMSLLIGRFGNPLLSPTELAGRLGLTESMQGAFRRFGASEKKWVALLCSQAFLEA